MWMIKKISADDSKIVWKKEIKNQERGLLAEVFIKGNDKLPQQKIREAISLLSLAKQSGFWIACDCKSYKYTQEETLFPPILAIALYKTGTLALRKVPRFGEHDKKCEFFRASVQRSEYDKKRKVKIRPLPETRFFCEHRQIDLKNVDRKKLSKNSTSSKSSEERLPALGRKLYTLLNAAEINCVKNSPLLLKEQYAKITEISKEFQIDKGYFLNEYLWTLPWKMAEAYTKIKENYLLWPKTSAPQGFFLLIAKSIDVDNNKITVQFKDKEYNFTLKQLTRSSGRMKDISAPYLVFITYAELKPKSRYFEMIKGFAVPIYSSMSLIPVESSYERNVLKKLITIQSQIKKSKNIEIEIIKPLFDITVSQNISNGEVTELFCRPDFLLKTSDKTLVLEVMGSQEEDYLLRKNETHEHMRLLGNLIAFDAVSCQKQKNWDEKLNELAKRIYAHFLS